MSATASQRSRAQRSKRIGPCSASRCRREPSFEFASTSGRVPGCGGHLEAYTATIIILTLSRPASVSMLRACRFRFLSIPLFLVLFLVLYVYLSLRPPYALYTTLVQAEQETSLQWIENTGGSSKYVKFRQLQGAGFNNQVRILHDTSHPLEPFRFRSRKSSCFITSR